MLGASAHDLALTVQNLQPRASTLQGEVVDMEEEFLNLGLDIIGLGVFNYKFGSITTESPVIKARHIHQRYQHHLTCLEARSCNLQLWTGRLVHGQHNDPKQSEHADRSCRLFLMKPCTRRHTTICNLLRRLCTAC